MEEMETIEKMLRLSMMRELAVSMEYRLRVPE
jgi:hypothetical protein